LKKDLSKPIIIIDAGHGGLNYNGDYYTRPNKRDEKTVNGELLQINEGVLNRAVAHLLSFKLDHHGRDNYVITSDTDLRLQYRSSEVNKIAKNRESGAILFSIHHNYYKDSGVNGFELFTYKGITPDSDAIAQIAGDVYVARHGSNDDRKIRIDGKMYTKPDGVQELALFKKANYHILRQTTCPSILFEWGFMSGDKDFEYISSDKGINDQVNYLFHLSQIITSNKK